MFFARLREIIYTSAFRIALLFLILFSSCCFILFGFIYWKSNHYMKEKIDDQLQQTLLNIKPLDLQQLLTQITEHRTNDQAFLTPQGLFKETGEYVAGQLLRLPEKRRYGKIYEFTTRRIDNSKKLNLRGIIYRIPHTKLQLVIAHDIEELHEFHEFILGAIASSIGLILILGGTGAIIIGLSARKQINGITLAIEKINQGNLKERLPVPKTTNDIGRLATIVNHMLDEIERLMQQLKGTSDNIAHDLRTPLTRLLAGLERMQRKQRSQTEYAEAINQAVQEAHILLQTFNALLKIAEIENSSQRNHFTQVDLNTIVSDVVEFFEPVAEEKQIQLLVNKKNKPTLLLGDAYLLFDALSNLLDNAIKFTPNQGTVTVSLTNTEKQLTLTIQDSGIGIPQEEQEAVFRRFYRAEHSRTTPGNGLGLSMVAAVAQLHNMQITLKEANPGCIFCLTLKHII